MAEVISESPDISSMVAALHQMVTDGSDDVSVMGAGDDKFDKLTALLMGDTKSPADQVAAGQVPKAPIVTVIPSYADKDALNNYGVLQNANSMVQLYINMMILQEKPAGYDITTEAAKAFNAQAKYAYDAMMTRMPGFWNFNMGSVRKFSNNIDKSEVHDKFLGEIFGGYGFDAPTLKSLDTILTNFVSSIKGLNPGAEKPSTQDFCMRLNLCPAVNITGDPNNVVNIYQPTTWIIYVKISANAYTQAVGKNSSVDKINFSFDYTVARCDLNVQNFQANKARFDQIFMLVTNKSLDQFSQDLQKSYEVKTDTVNAGAGAKP